MKRFILAAFAALSLAFGAFASGELVATGAEVRSWRVGVADGTALTNTLSLSRTICPWKIYVTNAVKRTSSTATVFTPTNYVVTASFVATNTIPKWTDFERTVTNMGEIVGSITYSLCGGRKSFRSISCITGTLYATASLLMWMNIARYAAGSALPLTMEEVW